MEGKKISFSSAFLDDTGPARIIEQVVIYKKGNGSCIMGKNIFIEKNESMNTPAVV